ncbi:MAG: Ig-like domain repeat protein [Clostridia bacterium]|nr:Ig-like domain repeat protein [Clostridia bacterium]
MLIIYCKSDGKIASNSGTNSYLPDGPPFEAEVQNAVRKYGGTPEDYAEYRLNDSNPLVQEIMEAGSYELLFDDKKTPIGVKTYARLTAEAAPNPAAVNETVIITATLPPSSPDTAVVFQLAGGQAYTEPVLNGQASHAYAFTMPGAYSIAVSSEHHGVQRVGVKVE